MTQSPSYLPPPFYLAHRGDPIDRLPGADELVADLTEAIAEHLSTGERHTHARRAGCAACAAAAADTAVRYLEANTRVVHSERLGVDELDRARKAIKTIPYLGSGRSLRLEHSRAADPEYPTVEDLLADLETIASAAAEIVARDAARERELCQYRQWREDVADLATAVVEQFEQLAGRQEQEQ